VLYSEHFGLTGPLFRVVAPSQPLYMGLAHREARAALEWGLCHEPSGLTLLVGDPGTGKTTLLRSVLERSREQTRCVIINHPTLPFDQMLREVLNQLGISSGSSKVEMLEAFDRYLAAVEAGGRVVVIVDEAQALSDAALEEIRLLSNRGTVAEPQLHFILVGQRELARRLLKDGLTHLNDRIGARAVLDRLSRGEAFEYVEYYLRIAGSSARRIFRRRALRRLVDQSGGLPRRLNVLCLNAMRLAYAAGRRRVASRDARAATDEYENFLASAQAIDSALSPGKRGWSWHGAV
jgi:type II secretory pathway predicted ATPase ExeA